MIKGLISGIGNMASSFSGGGMSDIGGLIKVVSELKGAKKASQVSQQTNIPTEAETQSNALMKELLNPNSPLLRQLTQASKQRSMADLQSQIRSMQMADRRNAAMGRPAVFFSPERADEAVSFLTSRSQNQMSAMAEQEAMNKILAAAQGMGQYAGPQAKRLEAERNRAIDLEAHRSRLPGRIFEGLQGLGGLFQQPSKPSTDSNILWNDMADKSGIMWNQKRY